MSHNNSNKSVGQITDSGQYNFGIHILTHIILFIQIKTYICTLPFSDIILNGAFGTWIFKNQNNSSMKDKCRNDVEILLNDSDIISLPTKNIYHFS